MTFRAMKADIKAGWNAADEPLIEDANRRIRAVCRWLGRFVELHPLPEEPPKRPTRVTAPKPVQPAIPPRPAAPKPTWQTHTPPLLAAAVAVVQRHPDKRMTAEAIYDALKVNGTLARLSDYDRPKNAQVLGTRLGRMGWANRKAEKLPQKWDAKAKRMVPGAVHSYRYADDLTELADEYFWGRRDPKTGELKSGQSSQAAARTKPKPSRNRR